MEPIYGPRAAARARRLEPRRDHHPGEGGLYLLGRMRLPYLVSGEIKEIKDLLATPAGVPGDANCLRAVQEITVLHGQEPMAIDRDQKQMKVRELL